MTEGPKKWRVTGVDRESGYESSVVVAATYAAVARLMAERRGIQPAEATELESDAVGSIESKTAQGPLENLPKLTPSQESWLALALAPILGALCGSPSLMIYAVFARDEGGVNALKVIAGIVMASAAAATICAIVALTLRLSLSLLGGQRVGFWRALTTTQFATIAFQSIFVCLLAIDFTLEQSTKSRTSLDWVAIPLPGLWFLFLGGLLRWRFGARLSHILLTLMAVLVALVLIGLLVAFVLIATGAIK